MKPSRDTVAAALALAMLCLSLLLAMLAPILARPHAAPSRSNLRDHPPYLPPYLPPDHPSDHASGYLPDSRRLITSRDSIDGHRIADRDLIERIERVAALIPAEALAGHRTGPGVQYLAHAFAAGDDAAVSYGLFQEPAAALAFGCALDTDLAGRCALMAVDRKAAYEDPPGVRCEPMKIALGAPAYEPDRCEPLRTDRRGRPDQSGPIAR